MDENEVVDSVCLRLKDMGFTIKKRCTTTDRGIDVVAESPNGGERYLVEAKGGTSSREGSARFGKPYTQSQVFDRVANGVFTCLEMRAGNPSCRNTHVVLAVPDQSRFHIYLGPVLEQLRVAGIEVWFESRR